MKSGIESADKKRKKVPNAKNENCSLFNKLGARLQFPLLIGIKSILIAFLKCFFLILLSNILCDSHTSAHTSTFDARTLQYN